MKPTEKLPNEAKVVIIGGGVFGTSTAFHLGLRGLKDDVLLLDKDTIAAHASSRAAGAVLRAA